MTSNESIFCSKHPNFHITPIHTVDGSQMKVSHVSQIFNSKLLTCDAYLIPKFILNILSVDQLCKLCLTVASSFSKCCVQDPQMEQTLRIGHKIGHLFELINHHILSKLISTNIMASTSSIPSLRLWNSCLGHVSFSRLQTLVSSG